MNGRSNRWLSWGLVGSLFLSGCGGSSKNAEDASHVDHQGTKATACPDATSNEPLPLHCALERQQEAVASSASTTRDVGTALVVLGSLATIGGVSLLAGGPLHKDGDGDKPQKWEVSVTTAGILLLATGAGLVWHGNQKAEQSYALQVRAARERQISESNQPCKVDAPSVDAERKR